MHFKVSLYLRLPFSFTQFSKLKCRFAMVFTIFKFLTCTYLGLKGNKIQSLLLEEFTPEGDEISLPTTIAHWRGKSSQLPPGILLTLRNIGVHQVVTSENNGKCPNVSLYICLWGQIQQSWESRPHVCFLDSLGLVSDLPEHFQKFVSHSSETVSRIKM